MREDPTVAGISAAMLEGTGLAEVKGEFPDRIFGRRNRRAARGEHGRRHGLQSMSPFVSIYSTFMQRSFDQIVHDICLQNLPVTLVADRAGIVGEDGKTPRRFDVTYLRCPAKRGGGRADGRK